MQRSIKYVTLTKYRLGNKYSDAIVSSCFGTGVFKFDIKVHELYTIFSVSFIALLCLINMHDLTILDITLKG